MQQMLDVIQVGTCGLSAEAGSHRMLQDAAGCRGGDFHVAAALDFRFYTAAAR